MSRTKSIGMTASSPPLVVDLDGTLTPSDTLMESIIKLVKLSPWNLFRLLFLLPKGRVAFKGFIVAKSDLPVESLPLNKPLFDYLQNEKEKGRILVLATASHKSHYFCPAHAYPAIFKISTSRKSYHAR